MQRRQIETELGTIALAFRQIARSFGKITPELQKLVHPIDEPQKQRRRPRLSAKRRQQLRIQGEYMGSMRGLSDGLRTKLKNIRKFQGVHAAIKAARNFRGN